MSSLEVARNSKCCVWFCLDTHVTTELWTFRTSHTGPGASDEPGVILLSCLPVGFTTRTIFVLKNQGNKKTFSPYLFDVYVFPVALALSVNNHSSKQSIVCRDMTWICFRVAPHVHWPPCASVSSCRGITSLRSKSVVHRSLELTIIVAGVWDQSVSTDGFHSWKVRPETSSSTRYNHTSTTRALGVVETNPFILLTTRHSFSTQFILPATFPNFIRQLCRGRMWVTSFVDQSRVCTNPQLQGLDLGSSLGAISVTNFSRSRIPGYANTIHWSSIPLVCFVQTIRGLSILYWMQFYEEPWITETVHTVVRS